MTTPSQRHPSRSTRGAEPLPKPKPSPLASSELVALPAKPIFGELIERPRPPGAKPPPGPEELVATWLASLTTITRAQYESDMRDLARFLEVLTIPDALTALVGSGHWRCEQLAQAWVRDLQTRKRSTKPATIRRRVAAMKSLLGAAHCPWTLKLRLPKVIAYRNTAGPNDETVAKLLDFCERTAATNEPAALRDVALINLLLLAGYRRSEAVSLDVEHIDWDRSGCWLLGKGRDEREFAPVPAEALEALRAWLAVRERVVGEADGPVFTALDRYAHGKRLTGAGVYCVVDRAAEAIGAVLWPHALRHRCITDIVRETKGDITKAAAVGRHKKRETTLIYVDNLKTEAATGVAAAATAQKRVLEDWRQKQKNAAEKPLEQASETVSEEA